MFQRTADNYEVLLETAERACIAERYDGVAERNVDVACKKPFVRAQK